MVVKVVVSHPVVVFCFCLSLFVVYVLSFLFAVVVVIISVCCCYYYLVITTIKHHHHHAINNLEC